MFKNLLGLFRASKGQKSLEEKPAQIAGPTPTLSEIELRKQKIRQFGRKTSQEVELAVSLLESAIGVARLKQLNAGRSGRKVSLRVVAQRLGFGRSLQGQIRVRNLIKAHQLGTPSRTTSHFVPA